MEEVGAAGDDLNGARHAEGGDQRHRVLLGVERVDRAAAAPAASFAARLGEAAPHGGGRHALVRVAGAEEDLSDLEQGDVGQRPARVALRRGDEAGNEARPHVGKVRGDRIGERELRLAAAEQLGGLLSK